MQMLDMFARDFTARVTAKYIDLGIKTAKIHFTNIRVRITESLKKSDDELLEKLKLDPKFFLSHRPYERFKPNAYKKLKALAIHYYNDSRTAVNVFADVITVPGKTLHTDLANYLQRLKETDKKIIDFGFADFNWNPDGQFNTFLQGKLAHTPLTVDSFWLLAQKRRSFFNGIDNSKSIFHLKETQWRYNKLNEMERVFYFLPSPKAFKNSLTPDIFHPDEWEYYKKLIDYRSKYFDHKKLLNELHNILQGNPL